MPREDVIAAVDATLIGGVVVKLGGWTLDGSVRGRLRSLKERLQREGAISDLSEVGRIVADRIVRCHLRTMARLNVQYDLLTWEGDILLASIGNGRRVGGIGDAGALSFYPSKNLSGAGDGGMVVTDDDELYFRAFGYHDQGHFPSRSGVEVGNRSIVGQNYRMNEITGAVLIAGTLWAFRRLAD